MARVINELNRAVSLSYTAADVAANLDYVAVNLKNVGGNLIYVSGIDMDVFADIADSPNIDLFTIQILRNLFLNPNLTIADQILSQTIVWRGRSQRTNDRHFKTRFIPPLKLDSDTFYTVVGFVNFTAAIVAPVLIDLTVLGEFGTGEDQTYFGKAR